MNYLQTSSSKLIKQFSMFVVMLLALQSGCAWQKNRLAQLPAKHSIRAEQLLILSNNKLKKDHPYLEELAEIRTRVSQDLDLKLNADREVHVYIFDNEQTYSNYLNKTYPGLPPRRAYFVGTPGELMVFTYWGDRVLEDLRHEFTHGLLHSTLKNVPLWLDEGLAEYYEHGDQKTLHPSAGQLAVAIENGWTPDMARLEQLEKVHEMKLLDYQEAWAWVHFMLHHEPQSREVLVSYIHSLEKSKPPAKLSQQMAIYLPMSETVLVHHLQETTRDENIQLIRGNNPELHHHQHH
jgi:hypothetical protein